MPDNLVALLVKCIQLNKRAEFIDYSEFNLFIDIVSCDGSESPDAFNGFIVFLTNLATKNIKDILFKNGPNIIYSAHLIGHLILKFRPAFTDEDLDSFLNLGLELIRVEAPLKGTTEAGIGLVCLALHARGTLSESRCEDVISLIPWIFMPKRIMLFSIRTKIFVTMAMIRLSTQQNMFFNLAVSLCKIIIMETSSKGSEASVYKIIYWCNDMIGKESVFQKISRSKVPETTEESDDDDQYPQTMRHKIHFNNSRHVSLDSEIDASVHVLFNIEECQEMTDVFKSLKDICLKWKEENPLVLKEAIRSNQWLESVLRSKYIYTESGTRSVRTVYAIKRLSDLTC